MRQSIFALPALLPLGAVAATGWLMLPSARAYTDLGFTLDTEYRDFRVFENFGDPEANDNTQEHPSFPGYTGATLAIWKGCVEWGSHPHGDGEGDPGQPGDLGSGGANFDPSFQGLATSMGEVGDNVHSELGGCSGGTHAFTQFFLDGTGWRTFYYECWKWEDGPEPDWSPEVGKLDLQGIATHEYGHALGLGHSDDPDATMYANTQDGKSHRTLEQDDITGVRALYGVASAAKPRIDGVSIDGDTLTLTGASFAAQDNEVWFTRATPGEEGTPIIALADSPDGQEIVVQVPPAAGPGDVLVLTGHGGERLSNAFPFDARLDCDPVEPTCGTTRNSVGAGAELVLTGSRSVAANDLVLNSIASPADQFGIFFYGFAEGSTAVGNGTLCVAGPLYRLAPVQVDPQGRASFPLDLTSLPAGGTIQPGDTAHFQWWYRDPTAGGAGYDFSDALAVPFCQ